mmetsp:Transcript_16049/g.52284  ORF Transcript_16049/g.52284 Transcript_16049/m.52284 type:complete len:158 (+) Transcript_16049:17-490(+)
MALRLASRGLARSVACSRGRPALSSATPLPGTITLDTYHVVSARTLDGVLESLEDLADSAPDTQIEVECAADVLNLGVGAHSFVLNKQAPNLQLWLSSPVRGPLRYDFDTATARWISTRDAHPMLPALAGDIRQLCGREPAFGDVEEEVASCFRKIG